MTYVDTGGVWLGAPGALTQLPDPDPEVETVRSGEVAIHIGLSGGRTVDVAGSGMRTWTYRFERMRQHEADRIEAFYNGSRGHQTLCLLDPVWPNRFTTNQASGGTSSRSIRGFAVYAGDAVALDTTTFRTGTSSIRWTIPESRPSVHTLMLPSAWPPATGWTGAEEWTHAHPVLPGVMVHLGAWVRPLRDMWIGWVPRWLTADGDEITAATEPQPHGTAGEYWQHITGAVTAPETAAWIAPQIAAASLTGTTGTPQYIHVDSMSMVYGITAPRAIDTLPGAGIPQVAITQWSQTIRHLGIVDGELELTEVTSPELEPRDEDSETG